MNPNVKILKIKKIIYINIFSRHALETLLKITQSSFHVPGEISGSISNCIHSSIYVSA